MPLIFCSVTIYSLPPATKATAEPCSYSSRVKPLSYNLILPPLTPLTSSAPSAALSVGIYCTAGEVLIVPLPYGSESEINNEYLIRWIESNHTHNFWYLYICILILILYSCYSYSKFEVTIILILNKTHDVVNFDSPWLNIYENHKISIILVRTVQYLLEGYVFASHVVFVFSFFLFFFFLNATTTKTVNFDEWFESLQTFMSIIIIFLKLWIWIQYISNGMSSIPMLYSDSLYSQL